jgi:hypothetical protein
MPEDDMIEGLKPTLAEVIAKLKAFVAECKKDDEKRKRHFGYFETPKGDL